MSIKYNERGEVVSVNGLTTGHHMGAPMQDAKAEKPEHNKAYSEERQTVTRAENNIEDAQPKSNGASSWNDLKDKPFYEEVVEESIVGLEFTGMPAATVAYQHNLNIPFQVGQVWDVAGNRGSAWTSQEVKQADDGTIYIGDYPNANVVPFYVTPNEIKCSTSWVNSYQLTDVNIVCVSGTVTKTTTKKLDPKYIGYDAVIEEHFVDNGEDNQPTATLLEGSYDAIVEKLKNNEVVRIKVITLYEVLLDDENFTSKCIRESFPIFSVNYLINKEFVGIVAEKDWTLSPDGTLVLD